MTIDPTTGQISKVPTISGVLIGVALLLPSLAATASTLTADLDGDGRDDTLRLEHALSGWELTVTTQRTASTLTHLPFDAGAAPRLELEDANADGVLDIIVRNFSASPSLVGAPSPSPKAASGKPRPSASVRNPTELTIVTPVGGPTGAPRLRDAPRRTGVRRCPR
ncbi:MAG: VCBS repeat-containing protein [Pseudomonadota bacterium]